MHNTTAVLFLPSSVFRTLEYLIRHLSRLATRSGETNMHIKNLAIVWAPNLLRWAVKACEIKQDEGQKGMHVSGSSRGEHIYMCVFNSS